MGSAGERGRPIGVLLGADWLERWLGHLGPAELKAYVALADLSQRRTYHRAEDVASALGEAAADRALGVCERLEKLGLVEVVSRRNRHHFHFRCRGVDGLHRAEPARPSIKEAIAFHKRMMEELIATTSDDETPALRERVFDRYPELRASYQRAVDRDEAGSWRLWLELSLHLMNRFEERFGGLKEDHAEVFKEVSAQLLRLKLEVIERLTADLLEHRDELFPIRGEGWVAGLDEAAFVALPKVRELSRKYRVGAEQIYLNTIETLQQEGLCVVELDARGCATDLQLPTTTGLPEEDERYLFLHTDDLTADELVDLAHTLERIAAVRRRYADYLVATGARVLGDLRRRERLKDPDVLLGVVTDRVNEALDLAQSDGEDPRVEVRVALDEVARRLEDAAAPERVPTD